jgi:hypothetical protein
MTHYENPEDQHNYPGESTRATDRAYRTMNDDHRRTTQRSPLSRDAAVGVRFSPDGWLALGFSDYFDFFYYCELGIIGKSDPDGRDSDGGEQYYSDGAPRSYVIADNDSPNDDRPSAGQWDRCCRVVSAQSPSRSAEVVKTLPDGTVLQIVGANKTVEDVVWRNVRDSDGNEGWVLRDTSCLSNNMYTFLEMPSCQYGYV